MLTSNNQQAVVFNPTFSLNFYPALPKSSNPALKPALNEAEECDRSLSLPQYVIARPLLVIASPSLVILNEVKNLNISFRINSVKNLAQDRLREAISHLLTQLLNNHLTFNFPLLQGKEEK